MTTAFEYGKRAAALGIYAGRDLDELAQAHAWAAGPVGRGRDYFEWLGEFKRGFQSKDEVSP